MDRQAVGECSRFRIFDLSDSVSREMARFETKPQFLWNPGQPVLSNRIRALEQTRPQEKRQRETSDAYRTPAGIVRYHLAADVGKEQGKGQVQQTERQGYMVQYTRTEQ